MPPKEHTSHDIHANEQIAIARLKLDLPVTLEFYRTEQECGYQGFGVQIQSANKFEAYLALVSSFKGALETYINHPVFKQSEPAHFERLKDFIKLQMKILNGGAPLQNNFNMLGSGAFELKNIFE